MLFSHQGETCLFIHIPKTGGNTIQSAIIDAGLSCDEMVSGGFRDGVDRFEIRGSLTHRKHQSLSTYLLIKPSLHELKIYSCVRKPFERLVSFYYSPHRNMVLDERTGAYVFRQSPEFVEADFMALVQSTMPAFQYLLPRDMRFTIKAIKRFPDLLPLLKSRVKSRYLSGVERLRLNVLQTESLSLQFSQTFGFELPAASRNVSPFREEARRVLGSRELRRFVEEESLHGLDLALFYP